MPNILHLVEKLNATSTIRSIISMAEQSSQWHEHVHTILVLSSVENEAIDWAEDAGIKLIINPDRQTLNHAIESADVVQLEYDNSPGMNLLLRRQLPPCRMIMWSHMLGDNLPHVLLTSATSMVDACIASTQATFQNHPAFSSTHKTKENLQLIIPPTDFEPLKGFAQLPHEGFNVGFIGDHADDLINQSLLPMSAGITLKDVRFTVFNTDDSLIQQAQALNITDNIEFKDHGTDIVKSLDTLDVFCLLPNKDASSTAFLRLQEAMFAGIPPVVIHHDIIDGLIKHNETGFIAHSIEDVQHTIEYLHNNPVERKRIGLNASIYARTHFGKINAASEFDRMYAFVMTLPKRNHVWGFSPYKQERFPTSSEVYDAAQVFIQTLQEGALPFETSKENSELESRMAAECEIANISTSLFEYMTGYASLAPADPYLCLWKGLFLEQNSRPSDAFTEYANAMENGLDGWLVQWYVARSLYKADKIDESRSIYQTLRETVADFNEITGDKQFLIESSSTLSFKISGDIPRALAIPEQESNNPTELEHAVKESTVKVSTVKVSTVKVPTVKTDASPIKVSAIVSTYASEEFMDGCLHNLVSQSLFQAGALEIIVIDANSPQDERNIVERYQANFDNIYYMRTPERETLYASWNRGIKMANGTYITNANTDDRHRHDALEILTNFLDAHPELALLYPGQIDTSVANETFATTTSAKVLNWPPYSYAELERHCIIGSQPMWRKSLHETYGYFRDEMKSAGDYEFWLRIGKNENMFRYPETLGLYFRNPAGIEHGSSTSEQETLQIWHEYGMFERGIPVILNGRLVTKAHTPQFTIPDSTASTRPTFDTYISQFESAITSDNFEEALLIAESAAANYPALPYPIILKAIVYRQKMEYPQAIEAIEQSIRIDETPEALVELIQISLATEQETEARRISDYVQEKYPEWKERIQSFYDTLLNDHTKPASGTAQIEDFEYYISSFSDLKERFMEFMQTKDLQKAETLALAATLKFPDNHESWVLKATSDRIKGDFTEAREAIHKSLLINDSPEALIELFQVSQALGDQKEAKNIADMFDVAYPAHSSKFRDLFPEIEL